MLKGNLVDHRRSHYNSQPGQFQRPLMPATVGPTGPNILCKWSSMGGHIYIISRTAQDVTRVVAAGVVHTMGQAGMLSRTAR